MFCGMQNSTLIYWKTFVVSCQSCIAKLVLHAQTVIFQQGIYRFQYKRS